jgi:hypothetical protein
MKTEKIRENKITIFFPNHENRSKDMKKIPAILVTAILISGFLLCSGCTSATTPAADRYAGPKMDPKESVRAFIGEPTATVEFERSMTNVFGEQSDVYKVNRDRFYVDAKTGRVLLASFLSRDPVKTGPYTKDSAEALALAYAKEHYPDFTSRNMQLTESKILDHGDGGMEYAYSWSEQLYGINLGNSVHVSVDPLGRIMNYYSRDKPAPAVQPAKITKDAANATAVDYVINQTRISTITSIESSPQLEVMLTDQNKVVWNVNLEIRFKSPYEGMEGMEDHRGGHVYVDAMDGEVVNYEPCM